MKNKTYINRSAITKIRIVFERKTGYKWFDERQESVKKFLGYTYKKQRYIPAGWSLSSLECPPDVYREPTVSFLGNDAYYVDETAKEIFEKAKVEIYYKALNMIGQWFESDKEAQEYVDGLVSRSERKFEIIIN